MKVLYYGGQKSGKSNLAELKALSLSNNIKHVGTTPPCLSVNNTKPYYIATYNNSYNDDEMRQRIERHKSQRKEAFITIEESFNLPKVIKRDETYLVDCISMWLLNNLEKKEEELLEQLDELAQSRSNIIFVLNDVNSGVIPLDKESRKFVDMTGIIGQKLASFCDEVYEVKLGLERRLK
jgi:adenosylcobinamide kinase/adenosylcobinamide-phosphate guanylyltransferase